MSTFVMLYSAFNKRRLSGHWGKRWQKAWGKRSESDSDEAYQRILRELYLNAHQNQLAHRQYSADNDRRLIILIIIFLSFSVFASLVNPLNFEEFMAQRSTWNDENEAKNMS
jgi:hypothetical protein